MNIWKSRFSLALAAAILVSAPGLPSYDAAAQVLSSPVSAHQAPAWLPVVSAVTAKLQASPTTENADVLRTLGNARLELTLNPQAASALLFTAAIKSNPSELAKLPVDQQTQILSDAVRWASGKLAAETKTLLEKSQSGSLSASDRARLREISAYWFYLPKDQAAVVRNWAPKRALALAERIKTSLGSKVNDMIGGGPTYDAAVSAESKLLFADTYRSVAAGDTLIDSQLAPYAANALDAASERLKERGVPAMSLDQYILANHRMAFGWDAPHKLIKYMRGWGGRSERGQAWTEFVSAVSLKAADRLGKSSSDAKVAQVLKKAGADFDLGIAIPKWHPLSGQAESVSAWLSTKYGAPSADPLGKGLKLGRIFGVPTLVTPGAFVAMGLLAAQLVFIGHGHIGLLAGVITSLAMYVGVLAHEIGHVLMARVFKTPTSKMELNLMGGGAFIVHEYRTGLPDFLVALAGPVVTLALAFIPIILGQHHLLHWLPKAAFPGLNMFVYFNVMMGVMNMLPLLPMDGGRMLRGVLTGIVRDDYTAWRWTRLFAKAVANVGLAAGIFLIMTGHAPLAWGLMILALIAGMGGGPSSAHPGTKLVSDKPAKK